MSSDEQPITIKVDVDNSKQDLDQPSNLLTSMSSQSSRKSSHVGSSITDKEDTNPSCNLLGPLTFQSLRKSSQSKEGSQVNCFC